MRLAEQTVNLAARVVVYGALVLIGFWICARAIDFVTGNQLLDATIGTFVAGAAGNTLAMRIYERRHLADIGFAWNAAAVRNLLLGLAGGVGAAALVLGVPIAGPAAELAPAGAADWSAALVVFVLILFGAVGEEMMFRGYGFQLLLGRIGPFATILPVAVLFAAGHLGNLNVSALGVVNTFGWGVVFGYAFLRSGDLWLPIGLHAGWNWTLPLLGANLSGITMNVTGYAVRWNAAALWSGGEYGPEGSILTSGIVVLLMFYLWRAPVRRQTAPLLGPRTEG